jgi:eukaryotic-like serine/threonine-protein kinase
MGVVFRARDTRLGRDVALKCPWPHRSIDAVTRQRFLRESRAASRISHPTIVPVYEVFEDRDLPWIAMEWVDGHTLADDLVRGEPLPVDQILQHAEDLTDALRAAHAKGILHRDIKPGNVLVGRDGRARLTDFGLARFFVAPDADGAAPTPSVSQLTEEGRVVGTLAYMAPEQFLGSPPDPRSDLFSLGVILYEMCTGRQAFGPTSQWDAYQAVLHKQPAAIGRLNYEVPRGFEKIIRKALRKRPDERYQDARDMLADIRALRRRIAAGEADSDDAIDAGPARARWRAWVWPVAALASLAAAAWLGFRPPPRFQLPFAPRQLTSAPGIETDPAISPDGTLVAYVADDGGQLDIWLVNASGGNPIRLTDDPAADQHPRWFPDGSAIAFSSDRGGTTSVWKIPALGGSATLLVANAEQPALSPDGARIAFVRSDASGNPRIYVSPVATPDRAVALTKDGVGVWGQYDPAWSPAGDRIAFADLQNIWVIPAGGGSAVQLTRGENGDSNPYWTSDGNAVVYTSTGHGTKALWRVDARGGTPVRLTSGSGPERLATIDRRGTTLVYTTEASDSDIALYDRSTGAFSRFGAQRRDYGPALSPSGQRVLFISERWTGGNSLAAQDLDGVQPKGPTQRLMERATPLVRYSPDGKWIGFWRVVDGKRDVWIASSDTGDEHRLVDWPSDELHPAWSPSGRRIVFISDRSGASKLWVAPFADGKLAGEPKQVTFGEGTDTYPEWSPDERSIAFVRGGADGGDVWVAPADGMGNARRVTSGANPLLIRWVAGPTGMLVSGTWGTGREEIRSVDASTGASKPLDPPMVGTSDFLTGLFDIALRGRLLAVTVAESRGDIWLLQGEPGSF